MELTRLAIVYIHLIACCAAIGLILTSDLAMVKKLIKGNAAAPDDIDHLHHVKQVVSLSLIALWITGIAIIALDVSVKGLEYFANPKLQAKIVIVSLLTLNGILLHRSVMPSIERFGSLLKLPTAPLMVAIFSGAFSAVSWFYAAMLGVGRPLSWKYSLVEILAAYPVLIVGGVVTMWAITNWAKNRDDYDYGYRLASA